MSELAPNPFDLFNKLYSKQWTLKRLTQTVWNKGNLFSILFVWKLQKK